jgi:hypothetical protein
MYPRYEENLYEDHPGYFFNVFNTITHWINRGQLTLSIVAII